MEPSYPSYPGSNTTQSEQQPQPTPPPASKKRWPFSKKTTLIGAVILLAIIIGGIAAMSLGGGKKAATKNGVDPSIYVAREGYPIDTNSSIGDATALVSEASGKVISFNGTPVLQPCGIITIADLRANKLPLLANGQLGPVEQNTYSGQGAQKLPKPNDSFAERYENANTCKYYSQDSRNLINIDVSQNFDSSAKGLQAETARYYQPSTDVEGLKAFTAIKKTESESNKNEDTYMLRSNSSTLIIKIKIEDPAKKETILKLAANRLKQAEATPMKSIVYDYKSPVMSNSVYTSCSILDDTNFKQVTGADASPLTKQEFSSAIGVIIDFNKKEFNYANYQCSRVVPDADGGGNMIVKATTFESDEMAKFSFQFDQRPDAFAKNVQAISPAIGDEAFYGDTADMNKAIVIRKGRLMLFVTYNTSKAKDLTPDKRISTLRPILESELSKVKGY